jgi:hypothetical protein
MSSYVDNCEREQLILAIERKLKELDAFKKVERRKFGYDELYNFASPEFPVLAIVGGLPIPDMKQSGMADSSACKASQSTLAVTCNVFLRESSDADTAVSEFAQRLWVKAHETPKWGRKSVVSSVVTFGSGDPEFLEPFVMFRIIITITYVHGTGGI